jgi:nucleotidyltransferase/DNA polymerase involved in DNA repair
MATVFEIKIKTVSAFASYNEKYIKEMFAKFLKEYKDEKTHLGFENTEVEVKRTS